MARISKKTSTAIGKVIVAVLFISMVFGGCASLFEDDNSLSNNAAQNEQSKQAQNGSDEASSNDANSNMSSSGGKQGDKQSGKQKSFSKASKQKSKKSSKKDNSYTGEKNSSFKVTFLDIGQGDSAIVQCNGHNMLIDGGPSWASSTLYSYCSRNNINKFDYVIATHADTDHTGGIPGALQVAKAKHAYCSVTSATQKSFISMKRILKQQGVVIKVPNCGDTFKLGSAKARVIGPAYVTDNGNNNDDSIMLKIVYGKTVFVFTGDANYDEEKGASEYLDGCDVLKVAHHGSASSSSYYFLRAAMPKNAVISVGKNSYGHPTEKALSRLKDCGAKVYRTDMQGDIVATSNGKNVKISVSKNANANTFKAG